MVNWMHIAKELKDHLFISTTTKHKFSNPTTEHYILEILRFKTKIHFILKKIERLMKNLSPPTEIPQSYFYLVIYQFFWEKTSIVQLWDSFKKHFNGKTTYIYFKSFLSNILKFSWEIALKDKSVMEKTSIQQAMPSFFLKLLKPFFKWPELIELSKAMNNYTEGIFFFRIRNPLPNKPYEGKKLSQNLSNEDILSYLPSEKLHYYPVPDIPNVYACKNINKNDLISSLPFMSGYLEIQQKPSFFPVKYLQLSPQETFLDLCAAPGTKTKLALDLIPKIQHIIANDIHYTRLSISRFKNLKEFRNNITFINSDGIHPPFRKLSDESPKPKIFDKILIDAPCTGSGTFLTHPELKWRQNPYFLRRNQYLQEKMILNAVEYLKPGGILVFSTCSLYYEEGEAHLLPLKDLFDPVPIASSLRNSYLNSNHPLYSSTGRFFPHLDKSIGFFFTVLKKK